MLTLSVPDMSCGHCKASVEAALSALSDAGTITVDLPARRVVLSGDAAPQGVLAALDAVGFPAQVVAA